MKNTLKQLLLVAGLFILAAAPLPAQTNTSAPAAGSAQDTVEIEQAKIAADAEVAKQKLETQKETDINSREAEKTEALNKQDAEKAEALNQQDANKSMVLNQQDAYKMMVHDLAWNSWVVAVLGILIIVNLSRLKQNRQWQETVRQMLDKNVPVTPELITALKSTNRSGPRIDPYGYLARGLILLAVGGGLLFTYVKAGWIVLLIGAAFFILWLVERLTANSGQSK